MKNKIVWLLSLVILMVPIMALHSASLKDATSKLNATAGPTGLVGGSQNSLETVIANIIKGALSLLGTVFFVLTVYAGYIWMTASGEEEKITKAKTILRSSIIGLAIVLGAYAITSFVTGKLMG